MRITKFLPLSLVLFSTLAFGQSNTAVTTNQTPLVTGLAQISEMNSTAQSNGNANNGNNGNGQGNGGPYESTYNSPTNGNNGNGQGQGNPNGYQDVPTGPYSDNNPNNPTHPAHPCNPNNKNFPNDGCDVQTPNVPLNDHIGLFMIIGGTVAVWSIYKRSAKQANPNVIG